MDKLIVNNSNRIKMCLNIETFLGEDLLTNDKAQDFINKYNNLLNSNMIDDFKKLLNETGVVITHFYIAKNNQSKTKSIYFNMMGSCVNNPLAINKNTFNHDLAVITYVDTIDITKNNIVIDNVNVYDFKNDTFSLDNGNKIRYNLNFLSIEEKTSYINKLFSYNLNSNDIKEIIVDVFENILVLYYNGNLYRNSILYDTNVEYLWVMDSYTTYLIYKDNSITYYCSEFVNSSKWEYKKVIYKDDIFLATLNKDNTLCLNIKDGFIPDTNILLSILDVSDIDYKENEASLQIIKNDNIVKIPLGEFNPLVVTDINYNNSKSSVWDNICL